MLKCALCSYMKNNVVALYQFSDHVLSTMKIPIED